MPSTFVCTVLYQRANGCAVFNEATRRFLSGPDTRPENLPASHLLIAGGVAGFMCWLLTYPTDVVKSWYVFVLVAKETWLTLFLSSMQSGTLTYIPMWRFITPGQ